MANEVIMPKNGMAMEEGKLIRWLKDVGDKVEKDEPLIEIETDKITMEEPAAHSGVLIAKWAEDGDTIPVLEIIGWIGEEGEAPPPRPAAGSAPSAEVEAAPSVAKQEAALSGGGYPATPYAKTLASESGIPLDQIPATGKHGEITAADVRAVKATPLAGRVAADMGIVDLGLIAGTGFGGKVTKDDVLAAATASASNDAVRVPMNGMRKAVARNMTLAHEIPCVTEHLRADVTDLFAFRSKLNENRENKFSVNDFIVKAVAKALSAHPELLVSLDGEDVLQHSAVNLGVAVSLDGGLIVPVVMDADKMGIEALAAKMKDLAGRARSGGLSPQEYSGSTFTVSNMGMFGIEAFTPIINLPNAAILGVCAAVDELALRDGAVESRKKMGLSLTFDHRLVDGVPPAKFLMTLRNLLENPMEILL